MNWWLLIIKKTWGNPAIHWSREQIEFAALLNFLEPPLTHIAKITHCAIHYTQMTPFSCNFSTRGLFTCAGIFLNYFLRNTDKECRCSRLRSFGISTARIHQLGNWTLNAQIYIRGPKGADEDKFRERSLARNPWNRKQEERRRLAHMYRTWLALLLRVLCGGERASERACVHVPCAFYAWAQVIYVARAI